MPKRWKGYRPKAIVTLYPVSTLQPVAFGHSGQGFFGPEVLRMT